MEFDVHRRLAFLASHDLNDRIENGSHFWRIGNLARNLRPQRAAAGRNTGRETLFEGDLPILFGRIHQESRPETQPVSFALPVQFLSQKSKALPVAVCGRPDNLQRAYSRSRSHSGNLRQIGFSAIASYLKIRTVMQCQPEKTPAMQKLRVIAGE